MIITQRCIPRRTVLRGLGASLALPLLDGMIPALTAAQKTAARPVRRFGVVYVPNGMAMGSWTPAAEGPAFELTPILQPLSAFRDQMIVVGGLNGPPSNGGVHASATTRFLTGISASRSEYDLQAGISMDQLVARQTARHTQLASLELALDSREVSGSCDVGFACAYTNTIAWRGPQTPLPMENNPRVVFERLFGDSGSTDPAVRLARMRRQRSLLDSVSGTVNDLSRRLGAADRGRLDEYLAAVRDVERRIQRAEEQSSQELPVVDQPPGIPASYEEHAKLMFDLMVLAYQSDLTRVSTFMLARELSGRTYPEIGVPDAHHPTSHHKDDRELIAKIAKVNTFHTTLLSYYLDRLRSTPDGDGSLLDHLMLIYGAGMSDSNRHDPSDLPILLLGGASGQLKGGRHIRYADNPPMANLLVTLLDKLDVPIDQLGNSTGKLELQALTGV
jgi:hypothetical protein